MQHCCHHVDTIRHPNSSNVTTKLYVTPACGCNKNYGHSARAIFTFPTVDVIPVIQSYMPMWKEGDTVELIIFVLKILFLPKYRAIYYVIYIIL